MSLDKYLRIVLVGLYVLTLASTLVTCIALGWAVRIFSNQCPLFAAMKFSEGHNRSLSLHWEGSTWGSLGTCDFCTFSAVCGAILSVMWFWFYILLSNFKLDELSGINVAPDTRLLLPSMVVNIPMVIVALAVACVIADGRSFLCHNVFLQIGHDCNEVGTREWLQPKFGRDGWNYIRASQWGAWTWFAFLLCTIVVGAFRVHRYIPDLGLPFTIRSSSSSSTDSLASDDEDGDTTCEESGNEQGFDNLTYGSGEATDRKTSRSSPLGRVEEEQEETGVGHGPGLVVSKSPDPLPMLAIPTDEALVLTDDSNNEREESASVGKGKSGKQKAKSVKK